MKERGAVPCEVLVGGLDRGGDNSLRWKTILCDCRVKKENNPACHSLFLFLHFSFFLLALFFFYSVILFISPSFPTSLQVSEAHISLKVIQEVLYSYSLCVNMGI